MVRSEWWFIAEGWLHTHGADKPPTVIRGDVCISRWLKISRLQVRCPDRHDARVWLSAERVLSLPHTGRIICPDVG